MLFHYTYQWHSYAWEGNLDQGRGVTAQGELPQRLHQGALRDARAERIIRRGEDQAARGQQAQPQTGRRRRPRRPPEHIRADDTRGRAEAGQDRPPQGQLEPQQHTI